MNPILTGPKIDSDKPIAEQIQQIRSYLFRFKDELELILSCIDSDNVTDKFEEKMYDVFSRKFEGSDTMSQIIQTTSLIKMEVKGAVQMGADKYSSFAITPEGIKIKSTGTFTVDSGNFSIDSDGNVSVKGEIKASSGSIGKLDVQTNGLYLDGSTALIKDAYHSLLVGANGNSTYIKGSRITIAVDFGAKIDLTTTECSINKNVDITGDAVIRGTLNVGEVGASPQDIRVTGKCRIDGDTDIYGETTFHDDVLVGPSAQLEINGDLIVDGDADFGSNCQISYKNRNVNWEQITYIDDYGAVKSKWLLSGGDA